MGLISGATSGIGLISGATSGIGLISGATSGIGRISGRISGAISGWISGRMPGFPVDLDCGAISGIGPRPAVWFGLEVLSLMNIFSPERGYANGIVGARKYSEIQQLGETVRQKVSIAREERTRGSVPSSSETVN
jgi:hypothetical protein